MVRTREETWGRIVYDPDADEFRAESDGENGESQSVANRPLSVGCLLTGRCNLGCAFCYGNREALPRSEVDWRTWGRIFDRLRSWGLMRVDLSGGEPALRPDLLQIVNAALSANLNTVLSTNGLALGPDRLRDLPPRVRVHVSLDSGFADIHERSRLLPNLTPSTNSFLKTTTFISKCVDLGHRVRVLTCIGTHNAEGLFQLGEHIATLGVHEWNISRILKAGRAQEDYAKRWEVDDDGLLNQIRDMREAYQWLRIRFSDRTEQNGYFLLVLPNGMLATQYTDGRDKVVLGNPLEMSLDDFRGHPSFNLDRHGRKWIAASVELQPLA